MLTQTLDLISLQLKQSMFAAKGFDLKMDKMYEIK